MEGFIEVRVWPLSERGRVPLIHLVREGEEVIGLTLCHQSARNAMVQPTPAEDLAGLGYCETCLDKATA